MEYTDNLQERGRIAAVRYLESKGYEIIEPRWEFPGDGLMVVAIESATDTLAFINVKTRDCFEKGLPREFPNEETRDTYELAAMDYVGEHPLFCDNQTVRFDSIGIVALGENAMLCHHVNCLG